MKVINKRICKDDGSPLLLLHADSPESRLKAGYETMFLNEARVLSSYGMNTITCTMYGDDVTTIYPWVTSTPSLTVDTTKLQKWHDQLKTFIDECALEGNFGVCILYLGERTNWNKPSQGMYLAWIDAMGPIFQDIAPHLILGWEEIGQSTSMSAVATFVNPIAARIHEKLPGSLVMLHNNPGQKPWTASPQVDVMCIQETSISNMNTSAQAAFAAGYAIHLHEWYNGFRVSNSQSTNLTNLSQLLSIPTSITSGYGIFAADYDTGSIDPSKLAYLYQALVNQAGTTQPPIPSNMIIGYSTKSDRSDFTQFPNGATLPTGNIYLEARQATSPVNFTLVKDGIQVVSRQENGAPYDMMGGSSTAATAYNAQAGSYQLTITDKIGTQTVTFSVGSVTQVPGCTDPNALNYNPNATVDDGSCVYPQPTKPDVVVDITANPNEVNLIIKVNGVPR